MTTPLGMTVRVVVCSDRRSAGTEQDTVGPLLVARLAAAGWSVGAPHVVPDDREAIATALRSAVDSGVSLVVTTGGTGFSPRDVTPEATRLVIDREAPGLAEAMRAAGRQSTPMADLSRGIAGVAGSTLIVNVPGSRAGATESLDAIVEILPHACRQAALDPAGAHD